LPFQKKSVDDCTPEKFFLQPWRQIKIVNETFNADYDSPCTLRKKILADILLTVTGG